MAKLTQEQIEQKMQQLKQLAEEVNALTKELVEAGAIELSEEDLEKVEGGFLSNRFIIFSENEQKPGPKENASFLFF